MPSRLRIVRTSLNSDIEERASFPVVEMAGFEPAMRQDTWLVGSHYLFGVLTHPSIAHLRYLFATSLCITGFHGAPSSWHA